MADTQVLRVSIALDEGGRGDGGLCYVRDLDDVVPGRICGRRLPCRDHRVRVMRGQCVVREILDSGSEAIWLPDVRTKDRDVRTHRGVVLELGLPAFLDPGVASSPVVPWDFGIGSVVQYHYVHHHDAHTRPWVDGKDATWIPQMCIDAVVEL